ncbi:MAG TPA: serine hydrolase domain-containing protein [Ferruginibacter sp.]|nr:serine hydrolase domain-containing protein [Ferruginibacter sp.]
MKPAVKAKCNIPPSVAGYKFAALLYAICFLLLCFSSSCSSEEGLKDKDTPRDSSLLVLPEPRPVPFAEFARLRSAAEHWYDSVLSPRNFNGAMLVAKNGNIVFEKYNGTGHLPGTDTITENTALHIASVTKTFTAMAILKMVQEGKLGLDDEMSKYFPAFDYPGVTIRNLLNHRSGLPNYLYFMEDLGWDKSTYIKNQDVLDHLISRKDELKNISRPGTHFNYCNTNYVLLALLIEKIAATSYPEYIRQTFLIPLQMKSSFVFTLADSARANQSYDWRGTLIPMNFLDLVYGDKNMYTTVRDLLIWDRFLSSEMLFKKEILDQAYTPYSNEKPGIRNYGLGWRMYVYPTGKKIIYHNGWWHGSNASFMRVPDDSAVIIVIGNKFNRSVYHVKELASSFGDYYDPDEDEEGSSFKNSIPLVSVKTKKPSKKKAR